MSQQPVEVYPNTITGQSSSSTSSHSNGSFGTVFIVLAVIVVVSAVACFLGRLCNKRYSHQKAKQSQSSRPKEPGHQARQKQGSRPKEGGEAGKNHSFQSRDGDIEFGFDKGIPNAKQGGNIGNSTGPRPYEDGGVRGEERFHGGEF